MQGEVFWNKKKVFQVVVRVLTFGSICLPVYHLSSSWFTHSLLLVPVAQDRPGRLSVPTVPATNQSNGSFSREESYFLLSPELKEKWTKTQIPALDPAASEPSLLPEVRLTWTVGTAGTVRTWNDRAPGRARQGSPSTRGPVRAWTGAEQRLTGKRWKRGMVVRHWLSALPSTWESLFLWKARSEALLHTLLIVLVVTSLWTLPRCKESFRRLVRGRGEGSQKQILKNPQSLGHFR